VWNAESAGYMEHVLHGDVDVPVKTGSFGVFGQLNSIVKSTTSGAG